MGGPFVNAPFGPFFFLYIFVHVWSLCYFPERVRERGRGTDGDKEYDHPPSSEIERDIRVAGWLLIGIPVFFFPSFSPLESPPPPSPFSLVGSKKVGRPLL